MKTAYPIVLCALLALSACGEKSSDTAEQGGKAAGEVLGGTISDDMIPLDQLESTSPPEKEQASGNAGATNGSSQATTSAETPEAEPAEADPAAEEPAAEE